MNAKQSTIQVRLNAILKQQAEELFDTLGTSTSEAVRLFLAQSVHDCKLPFTPSATPAEGDDRAFGALAHYANGGAQDGRGRAKSRSRVGSAGARAAARGTVTIVDETVLLRYLLVDEPAKADRAHRLIVGGNVRTYPENVARAVDALEGDYRVPRSMIGNVVALLLDDLTCEDETVVRIAARLFGSGKHDFNTCLMQARNTLHGCQTLSFK
ncbi:MAG: type II toxin-antitoxin system RelB/DinJ family antitoxin [Eggerthellaceae bacterium]|nr:type II toxin-antitoxin system RelB/DinJ family antitoxin [Eggerthellaceae bacterium]